MARIRISEILRRSRASRSRQLSPNKTSRQRHLLKNNLDSRAEPQDVAGRNGDRATAGTASSKEGERAQCALDSIADALISTSLAGRVTYLNLAAERLTGWVREDAIGPRIVDIFRIFDAETRATVPSPVAPAIKETRTISSPVNGVLIQRDGSEKSIEYSAAPIRSSRGPTTGAVVVIYDMSKAGAVSLTSSPNDAQLSDRLTQAIEAGRENSKPFYTEALLKNASIAMRNAKDLGRNNYKFYRVDRNSLELARQATEAVCVLSVASSTAIYNTQTPQFAENQLLAVLSDAERQRWRPLLEWTDLAIGEVLCESGTALAHVYFPTTAVIALLYTMQNGASAASAMVGNDGVLGVSIFMGGESTISRALVQSAGKCLRIAADLMKEEFHRSGPVLRLLLRYTQALITQMVQSAACHRHHSLDQQLCRWLLSSFDRLRGNEFSTTRQVIANVLGTQRGHITEHLLQLRREGVIHYADGHITLLKRELLEERSCECYLVIKSECARLLPNQQAA